MENKADVEESEYSNYWLLTAQIKLCERTHCLEANKCILYFIFWLQPFLI